MGWFLQLAIGIGIAIVSFLLAPKPPGPKPPSLDDLKAPTAEHGRPIPVIFGTIRVKSPNAIWSGDKSIRTRSIPIEK